MYIVIDTKAGGETRRITLEYDFGADLSEALSFTSADVVFSHYVSSGTLEITKLVRKMMADKLSDEAIKERMKHYKLPSLEMKFPADVQKAIEKINTILPTLTPDERLRVVKELNLQPPTHNG